MKRIEPGLTSKGKPVEATQGAGVKSFEELRVYQEARELTNEVYATTRMPPFAKDRELVIQVRRACVSVMSNIAEGFERGGRPEFIRFLTIAKGSCGETRAQFQIARDQGYVNEEDYERIVGRCRKVSGMLANLIAYLRKPATAS